MNSANHGYCSTLNKGDSGQYNIPLTADGNSVLTGDGATSDPNFMTFTVAEIEVFLLC